MKISASDLEPTRLWPATATTSATLAVGPAISQTRPFGSSTTSSPTKPPPPPPLLLPLDAGWYRIVWLLVLALHSVCATYLISTGVLYRYMDHPYLTYFADLLAPAPDRHFGIMAAAMVAVGCGHVACFAEMLVVSVVSGQLAMTWSSADIANKNMTNNKTTSYTPPIVAAGAARMSRRLSSIQQIQRLRSSESMARLGSVLDFGSAVVTESIYKPVFSRHGILGVESVHFDLVFATRELIEIGFQTLQAYRISQMITRPWINALFVALVVANCWTTPFWQHFLKRSAALCRLCCIATDIVLNMCTNMVIPWIIFSSYFYEYDREEFGFESALIYDDIWFTNLVSENRLLFALSTVDFLSKLIPHVTILGCLVSCKSLLVRRDTPRRQVATHPSSGSQSPPSGSPSKPAHVPRVDRRDVWRIRIVHAVFLLWGAALVAVHLQAAGLSDSTSTLPGCKQFIRPWFVTGTACATYEHNCHRTPPSQLPLSVALEKIHPSTLLSLVVSHCDDLVVPRTLQQFSKLLCLEFYNVTLRAWPADAAVSASIHTSLVALLLIHTNMTGFPDGLLGPLPASLTDVELAYTNLTYLPDDLHKRWHAMSVVYFEYSQFREFPATLEFLEVNDLSLIGNHIEKVPQLATIPFRYFIFALSYNPIRELPATIDGGATFGYLDVEATQITTLPSWIGADSSVVENLVYLYGSPVCATAEAATAGTQCGEPYIKGTGRYPLATMAPRRLP